MTHLRLWLLGVLCAALALTAASPAAAATPAQWRLAQPAAPAPPEGSDPAPYPVRLGPIADLQFLAPNRGIMVVGGNGTGILGQDGVVKEGLYRFDGTAWTPFANVCGGGLTNRIAWAGPHEFWVIATTRTETRGTTPQANTLCHIRDGAIVGSYATSMSDADAYLDMDAAACIAPDDCWFAGEALDRPNPGVFMLHWDGQELQRVIGPQGRPIKDLEPFDGATHAGLTVSGDPGQAAALLPDRPEPRPLLLRSIAAGGTTTVIDPFLSTTGYLFNAGKPTKAQAMDEFVALDADDDHLWAAGNQATSGPDSGIAATKRRGPLLAIRDAGASEFRELAFDPKVLTNKMRVTDVAANPGTGTAWLAIDDTTTEARGRPLVVKVSAQGTIVEQVALPLADDPDPNALSAVTGTASRITCPAADECWLATTNGWLYHLSDGTPLEQDDDPYFQTYLSARPADATSVPDLSDAIPVDDSGADLPFISADLTLAEPVEAPDLPEPIPAPRATKVRVKAVSRRTVEISFRLSARANVDLRLQRGKVTVARYRKRGLARGPHKVRLRVSVKRWPNSIKLDVTHA
jgi:hypothetical protein